MNNQQTVMVTTLTFDTKPQCLFSASLYYIHAGHYTNIADLIKAWNGSKEGE